MSLMATESSELAKIMSSAIAPVFMITGIAAILSTMSLRYGRVIDRIRQLLTEGPKLYRRELGQDHMNRELKSLYSRARLLRLAIIVNVVSIFAISLTIFALFFSLSFGIELPYVPQVLFILALLLMMIGLLLFINDFAMSLTCIEHDMNVRTRIEMADGLIRSSDEQRRPF